MSVSEVPAELVEAYNRTQYLIHTENGEIVLRIGQPSKAIAALIEAAAADGGAFITAENPFSQPLTVGENKDRQDRLREDLAVLGALIIDGAGQGEDPSWPAEASFTAIGITRDQKFGLEFDILTRDMIETSRSGNAFNDHPRLIARLHEPDKFILAIVQVEEGFAREPRYVRGALDTREPPFEQNAIQFNIKRLLDRAEAPA